MTDKARRIMKQLNIQSEANASTEMQATTLTRYLLYQEKKISMGLLDDLLPMEVKEAWEELLALLERRGRKLVEVTKGSITMKVYSPNQGSIADLQELAESGSLDKPLRKFLTNLGKSISLSHTVVTKSNSQSRKGGYISPDLAKRFDLCILISHQR